jgi:hypothetical protein
MFHRTHTPTHPPREETATEHLQRDENRSKYFAPQNDLQNPSMMSRVAISLRPKQALGNSDGSTAARLQSVQNFPCRDGHPRGLIEET